ncbi:Lrp/AsnC family transcriptional regulator [Mitsuaria sp. GD03876]|uniref:Lrp/AsnC family transcriptional regulator n=1 Tax=Mitsuaria sp. GD03876 TaxID=2975399 RepID=UPI00244D2EE7|nr:Lrp/AsnC family transcriptional regulator [Mitsuaria sp. GD03876]MDH0865597.1 Lrp/AsnC family transcriptional regulator [Mitsuaria sp. GD03876]
MSRDTALTEIEVVILEHLQRDARLSSADLAEQLHLSNTPVWRRIKKMQESGLIQGYHAHVDARRLGLGIEAFLTIGVHQHDDTNIREFTEAVATIDEIVACDMVSGRGDFLLRVVAKDMDAYADFVNRVAAKLPGVREIQSSFVLRTIKPYSGLPIRKAALE